MSVAVSESVIASHPMAWLELCASLQGQEQKIITAPELTANWMQREEDRVLRWMEENGHPGRIIKLKGRRQGSSTGTLAQMAHRLRARPTGAFICGLDYDKNVRVMEDILWRFIETDRFEWGVKGTRRKGSGGEFSNGSQLTLYSANAGNAGRGQGAQFGLFTEAAYYPTTEGRSENDLFRALFQLVPRKPGTVIVIESTPNGEGGKFYETWQGAITFEELQAGKIPAGWNGFVSIFYPWHEFPDYTLACTSAEAEEIMATLTEREEELLGQFPETVDVGRLKWRRMVIAGPDFEGDEEGFEAEYPSDDVTCFATTGTKYFSWEKLRQMKDAAHDGRCGVIEWADAGMTRAVFRDAPERESFCRMWEEPKHGCSYTLVVDTMTGEQAMGRDPDNHAPMVLREGFFDVNGRWWPPAVVARLADCAGEMRSKTKEAPVCRWHIDVLEENCTRLSALYGFCQMCVEMNKDLGLVERAKMRGKVPIYVREQWNHREQKRQDVYGWMTTAANRGAVLAGLQAAVRQYVPVLQRSSEQAGGIDVWDRRILWEMGRLVTKENGRVEAGSGAHDDTVMSLAIGFAVKGKGTVYHSVAAKAKFAWREGREKVVDHSHSW